MNIAQTMCSSTSVHGMSRTTAPAGFAAPACVSARPSVRCARAHTAKALRLVQQPWLCWLKEGASARAEHVAVVMQILASAMLLGGQGFLAAHGPAVAHVLGACMGTLNERGTLLVTPQPPHPLSRTPWTGALMPSAHERRLPASACHGFQHSLLWGAASCRHMCTVPGGLLSVYRL